MAPFRSIAVFYHVATLNSVAAAAEQLNVTSSAVSQQLRALETQIGTSLFVRVGRKIKLTEAGERYFDLISQHVEDIIKATDLIQGNSNSALLTIRATPTVSTKWLLPRLPRFLDANPDIDIRLDGSNEPTDFNRDLVDMEIRHGAGRWPGLHVEGLVEERFIPVCAPSLLSGNNLVAKDLLHHRLIHSVKAQIQWKTWFAEQGLDHDASSKRLYFDRSHMAVDAAVLGMGMALESTLMMEQELRAGQLLPAIENAPNMPITTQWIVCPYSHLRRSRVKRFIQWIKREAQIWFNQDRAIIG
ncbi:LysR substrate-binding domain-containing protein [Thalassospira sp. TSL5-1]|uniref:LysR substrate-binding domain-containing protein n=1 Tax=Thalassospira sp. TSL5-1 TaxID=1544451 RepID=UPI00093C7E8E|nr:LysR substrate-binding domain-containing protein [Thalassospira sp. TSL5-1]OKH86900.1 LysR family transcriptional regulator [Thalassospira sp. TSL5-1]